MEEEKLLERKFGRHCGFRIPDDYFARFESDIMEKLPEQKPAKVLRMPTYVRIVAAAACFVAVVAMSGAFLFGGSRDGGHAQVTGQGDAYSTANADYTFDQMSDYTMVDNDDFYTYVTNE